MSELQLPPSVRDLRGTAIEAIANRTAQIDLSPLLVYRIASTPAAALPFLAWHFDILSPLYQLLAPGADPRARVAAAIELKKQMGTPYAVKTALANLGWPGAMILEGQDSWGGVSWPSNQGWAVCRLQIPLNQISIAAAVGYNPALAYPAGAIVTFNGAFFLATAPVPVGRIPQFATIDDVPDLDLLSDVDKLVQAPWQLFYSPIATRAVTAAALALIEAAFYFFAPRRCWLDSIWFVTEPMSDDAPTPTDSFTIGGIAEIGSDAAPAPAEGALTMTIAMGAMLDAYGPIAPFYNARYYYKGITYGQNEPQVAADGPLVINGVTHGESS